MKEIGGYIELDTYRLPMLHEDAIALNCGRNALAYLLKARNIKRLWVPRFICDSVTEVCEREGVPYSLYGIGMDFLPSEEIVLGDGEWLYFVNYYSQFDNEQIRQYTDKYKKVIVDNAQSYFQMPLPHVDTIYTCRKYFGVPDGAFLYSDAYLDQDLPMDESFERMRFLLGRYERSASEFYGEYVANNELFAAEPIKRMSKLTFNLLHGLDYEWIKSKREDHYRVLHDRLGSINNLKLSSRPSTFMYPLFLDHGSEIRAQLQQKRIYIPILWPNVCDSCDEGEKEHQFARDILPLPIDQRYSIQDITYMTEVLQTCLKI